MNIEIVKSVIRSVIQILGVLLVINVQIPFIKPVNEALTYLLGELDGIVAIIQSLSGIGLTLYGFFIDKNRFKDREVGKEVEAMAKSRGITVKQYLKL